MKTAWIMEYYNVSRRKAEEYLTLLSEEQINIVKDHTTFSDKNS